MTPPGAADLIVLFDGDCGFCSWTANLLHRLDRGRALHLVPLRSAAEALVDAPAAQDLRDTLHVRDRTGRWERGSAAWLRIARAVPALRPIAVAARVPLVRWWIHLLYRLVAGNRHRLSRLLGLESCTYRD